MAFFLLFYYRNSIHHSKHYGMKKIFYSLSILITLGVLFAACTGKQAASLEQQTALKHADTVGLAEFQDWKAQNERTAAIAAYKKQATPVATRRRSSTQSGSMGSTSENQAKVEKKKGWSKAAKGATIGGASGAVLGAVINKRNRALGAVIGGVVGGGVGYGIGRSMDKKDGR